MNRLKYLHLEPTWKSSGVAAQSQWHQCSTLIILRSHCWIPNENKLLLIPSGSRRRSSIRISSAIANGKCIHRILDAIACRWPCNFKGATLFCFRRFLSQTPGRGDGYTQRTYRYRFHFEADVATIMSSGSEKRNKRYEIVSILWSSFMAWHRIIMFLFVAVFVKHLAFSVTVLDKWIVVDEDNTGGPRKKKQALQIKIKQQPAREERREGGGTKENLIACSNCITVLCCCHTRNSNGSKTL